ncbi:unnamed protein product [Calypogeia fissa]
MATGNEVRALFRSLLRVRRQAFAGDEVMVVAAAAQIRHEFEANRHVSDPEVLRQCVAKAREAVDFISMNVVQAKLNDRGNYEMKLDPKHAGESLEEVVPKKKTPGKVSTA